MENLNNMIYHCYFPTEQATNQFGARLFDLIAPICHHKCALLYLVGELGAGKSTFSRAFIRASGTEHNEIPSPTYTIQEIYKSTAHNCIIHHFDLYRVHDFMDLQTLGVYDHMNKGNIFLVEWPQIMMEHYGSLMTLYFEHVPDQPEARVLKIHVDFSRVELESEAMELGFKESLEKLLAHFPRPE